ncbi:hypothetical protein D3C83_183710 [compost metagenome]
MRSSELRITRSLPSSCLTTISGRMVLFSSPFGPLTVTSAPLMVTVTPLGTGIGNLPIRDIDKSSCYQT